MKAYEHTEEMLAWWRQIGIHHVDLAIRRPSGAMIWRRDLDTDFLPLPWARAQNVRLCEVYVRPARRLAWPIVFLDDVAWPKARAVANKYEALVVETSWTGGCHIWLACSQPLTEDFRREAQRWLAPRIGADPASISGEHLGRLAGFKNWKRGGTWVNVLATSLQGRRWDPSVVPQIPATEMDPPKVARHRQRATDTTPSGREWGWVCGLLEKGCSPQRVYVQLLERACIRRGADAPRYARRTLQRALERTGRTPASNAKPRQIGRSISQETRSMKV